MKAPKKTTKKRSENAKAVAREVVETLGKGKHINFGKIMIKKGYAKNSAKNPLNVTKSKSYKEVISPIVARMEAQRELAIARMNKTVKKAKYRDAVDAVDKMTKNIQLLTGGKTEDSGITELAESIGELIKQVK